MDYTRPSERLEFVLKPYIVERLRQESEAQGWGYAAKVARATHVTRTHAHNVINKDAGISEDFVHDIAAFWGMTPEDLGRRAEEALAQRQRAAADEDMSPAGRLMRLIEEEARERGSLTAEQISRATSLAAVGGKITRADVRKAIDRGEDGVPIDSDLEREHTVSRGKRKRPR